MVVSRNDIPPIRLRIINEKHIEQVNNFKYLGCLINNKCDPVSEFNIRIGQARTTFQKLTKFLANNDLIFQLRYRVVKCYVWFFGIVWRRGPLRLRNMGASKNAEDLVGG